MRTGQFRFISMATATTQEEEVALINFEPDFIKMMTEVVDTAIFNTYRKLPFFAFLIERMKIYITRGLPTAGMGPEGQLYVNPDFFLEVACDEDGHYRPDKQRGMFIIAHEVLHAALRHHPRVGSRNPKLWNVATDWLINARLLDEFAEMFPQGTKEDWWIEGLLLLEDRHYWGGSAQYDTSDFTSEELYSMLLSKAKEMQVVQENLPGGSGGSKGKIPVESTGSSRGDFLRDKHPGLEDQLKEAIDQVTSEQFIEDIIREGLEGVNVRDGKGDTPTSEEEWEDAVQEAYTGSKIAGKCGTGIEHAVGKLLKPSITWKQQLVTRVNQLSSRENLNNYTFTRPNRRNHGSGIILPSLIGGQAKAAVSIDNSGSMDTFWDQCISDFEHIRQKYNIDFYFLMQDTQVHDFGWFKPNKPLPRELPKGGGTDFGITFDHIAEQDNLANELSYLVYFTDLYGSCGKWAERPPDYNVIWITYTDEIPPFGEVIRSREG